MVSTILFVYLSIVLAPGFAQQSETEAEFQKIETEISNHIAHKQELEKQLHEKASRIQEIKNQKSISYFQQQKLENLLKQSQSISGQIFTIDFAIRQLRSSYEKIGKQLIDQIDIQIKDHLSKLEREHPGKSVERKYLKEIKTLRSRKESVKRRIIQKNLQALHLTKVVILPTDTPQKIRQKADLLKDQEDKLRRFAKILQQKRDELQKEVDLRGRIDDLVSDLALFDQQEEMLGELATNTNEAALVDASNMTDAQGRIFQKTDDILVGPKDFDFSELTTDQLENILVELAAKKKRVEVQADSLRHRADTFYQAAEKSKK